MLQCCARRVSSRPSELRLQFRVLLRKAKAYQEYLNDLRATMVGADRFMEVAEFFRLSDVERAMSSLSRALELQVCVANTQAGILMSVTSDMVLIPNHLPRATVAILREELDYVTAHSRRSYLEVDESATETQRVNHAFEAVTSNGSRVYLSTMMLERLVNMIVEKMEPLRNENNPSPEPQ